MISSRRHHFPGASSEHGPSRPKHENRNAWLVGRHFANCSTSRGYGSVPLGSLLCSSPARPQQLCPHKLPPGETVVVRTEVSTVDIAGWPRHVRVSCTPKTDFAKLTYSTSWLRSCISCSGQGPVCCFHAGGTLRHSGLRCSQDSLLSVCICFRRDLVGAAWRMDSLCELGHVSFA
jgi:hypothetical protein